MGRKSCLTVRLLSSITEPIEQTSSDPCAPVTGTTSDAHRPHTDIVQAPIAAPVILAIASFRPADPVVGEFRANDNHHLRPLDIGLCMLYPSSGSIAAGMQATIGNITARMYLQWSRKRCDGEGRHRRRRDSGSVLRVRVLFRLKLAFEAARSKKKVTNDFILPVIFRMTLLSFTACVIDGLQPEQCWPLTVKETVER
jgi:hypothetical protein